MSEVYTYKDYDKYLSLKPSPEIWLIIAYLMRPYIFLISTLRLGRGGSGAAGVDGLKNMFYPDDLTIALGIFATFPVFLFVAAWGKRKPGAADFIQKVWRHGAGVLIFAAALNIAIVFLPWLIGEIHKISWGGWLQVGIATIIIVYLLFSRRVKDTFTDFPRESQSD